MEKPQLNNEPLYVNDIMDYPMLADSHTYDTGPNIAAPDLWAAWEGVSEEEAEEQAQAALRHAQHLAEEGAKDPDNGSFWTNQLKQLFVNKEQRASYEEFMSFAREMANFAINCCGGDHVLSFLQGDAYLNDKVFGHSDHDGHNHGSDSHTFDLGNHDHKKDKKKKRKNTSWFGR